MELKPNASVPQGSIIQIPKGNTQLGVLQKIYDFLAPLDLKPKHILDIPCGKGEFVELLKQLYPQAEVSGVDLFENPMPQIEKNFIRSDMRIWDFAQEKKYDLIFSVSGVMQCDDLFGFFEKAKKHLSDDGYFIVTNDHVMTIRDRLSFFFFGEVKRFRKYFSKDEGNWNLVLIPALLKHFENQDFKDIQIHYCSIKPEDLIFLIFFPFFFVLDLFPLFLSKSNWSLKKRLRMYPWKSYIYRHYFISGKK